MPKNLHVRFLTAALFLGLSATWAQKETFTYVISDLNQQGSGWNAVRRLDLKTGTYSAVLLNGIDQSVPVYDATSRKLLVQTPDARFGTHLQAPFSTGVAAAAYDARHQRLYFTPMFVDQLRYIDMKTGKVYYITDQPLSGAGPMHNDEAKCITRMVIAPDGYGYAISNDGNTMVQFSTTGKQTRIKKLGALVDDPANSGISIHNSCSSFGGDMVADDKGNLYILSARNQVFKVDLATKVAKHLGGIKGLGGQFTVNGAVVDADGALLVSSAVDNSGYYKVNPATWEASLYALPLVYRSSDLANGNYLASAPAKGPATDLVSRVSANTSNLIQVFPNPVVNQQFTLQFNRLPAGEYRLEVTDVMGRTVLQQKVVTATEESNQVVTLSQGQAKGVYLLRVSDKAQKTILEQKLMVQ